MNPAPDAPTSDSASDSSSDSDASATAKSLETAAALAALSASAEDNVITLLFVLAFAEGALIKLLKRYF
jgi:hypothetical protein